MDRTTASKLTAAGYNVRINVKSLKDMSTGEQFLNQLRELEKKANEIEKTIQEKTQDRGGISLD